MWSLFMVTALCNDGTPGGYWRWTPPGPANGTLLYLPGGGICATASQCAARQPDRKTGPTGSAPALPPTGLFAPTSAVWNADVVVAHYCSSDMYLGSGASDGYTFQGAAYVAELLDALDPEGPLVVAGSSAGGFGVAHHADAIRARWPAALVVADGAFLPAPWSSAAAGPLAYWGADATDITSVVVPGVTQLTTLFDPGVYPMVGATATDRTAWEAAILGSGAVYRSDDVHKHLLDDACMAPGGYCQTILNHLESP